jgi:ribonucleoside-diphosphate reductase alpha chain
MDAFATSISLALQYGVPLEDLVQKFSHMRFEPSGFTNNKQIPIAKSLMDYIFRYLGGKFLSKEVAQEEASVNPTEAVAQIVQRSGPAEDQTQANLFEVNEAAKQPVEPLVGGTVEQFMAQEQSQSATFQNQEDSPPCPNCGSITVRSGACYVCTACGTSSGCG